MDFLQQLSETISFLEGNDIGVADVGIFLNREMEVAIPGFAEDRVIQYSVIPHFPSCEIPLQEGNLHYGLIEGKKALIFHGSYFYHQGISMKEATFPVRLAASIGCKRLWIIDNAIGLNPNFPPGSLMLVRDHINLLPENPLRGRNYDTLGPRFPDMGKAYNLSFNNLIQKVAIANNLTLHEGVYAAVMGPNSLTMAESKFLLEIGADAAGYGIAPEVIVANHMGTPCSALVSVSSDGKHNPADTSIRLGHLIKHVIQQI